MKLIPKPIYEQLLENGRKQTEATENDQCIDFKPLLKLFTPDANCTWLITELDPDEPAIAFGLCDLGLGYPELGSVSIQELQSVRGKLGLPIERDLHFEAKHPISVYAHAAHKTQCITEVAEKLERSAYQLSQEKGGN